MSSSSEQNQANESRLHPLARESKDELEAKGIHPTLDEIVWLNDLARRVENPSGGDIALAAGCPVQAGNAWLWPFTVAAAQWYIHASKDLDDEGEAYSVAFAMAHGRVDGAFDGCWTYRGAKRAISQWRRTLTCTNDELVRAVAYVQDQDGPSAVELDADHPLADKPAGHDEEDGVAPPESDWSETIALLCANVCGPPELWQSGVSHRYLLKQIHTLNQQSREKGEPPDAHDPHTIASRNLLRATLNIEWRHRQAQEAEGEDNG